METIDRIFELAEKEFKDQKDFAAALGVSKTMVSAWRTGISHSYERRLSEIAKVLGTTVSCLLGESVSDSDTKKEPAPMKEDEPKINIIKVRGRDGSYIEKRLTDEQLEAWKAVIAQLPDADDL